MVKKIIKYVAIIAFIACIAGIAFIYFEDDVELLRLYSMAVLYITLFVIFSLILFLVFRYTRERKILFKRPADEFKKYWQESLSRVRHSGLAREGNPFRKYPVYLYLTEDVALGNEQGLPVMGAQYKEAYPNIFIGGSVMIVAFRDDLSKERLGLIRKIGVNNIDGLLVSAELLSRLKQSDSAKGNILDNISQTIKRTLPLFLICEDQGEMRDLARESSPSSKLLNMAPIGCINDLSSGPSRKCDSELLNSVAILRDQDTQTRNLSYSRFWAGIEKRLKSALNQSFILHNINGYFFRGTIYSESTVGPSRYYKKGLHNVLKADSGFVEQLNTQDVSWRFRLGVIAVFCFSLSFMTYTYISTKNDLESIGEDAQMAEQGNPNTEAYGLIQARLDRLEDNELLFGDIYGVNHQLRDRLQHSFVTTFGKSTIDTYLAYLLESKNLDRFAETSAAQIHSLLLFAELLDGNQDSDITPLLTRLTSLMTIAADNSQLANMNVALNHYLHWSSNKEKESLKAAIVDLITDIYGTYGGRNTIISMVNEKSHDILADSYYPFNHFSHSMLVKGSYTKYGVSRFKQLSDLLVKHSHSEETSSKLSMERDLYIQAYRNAWQDGIKGFIQASDELSFNESDVLLEKYKKQQSQTKSFFSDAILHVQALKELDAREVSALMGEIALWHRLNDDDYREKLKSNGLLAGISDKGTLAIGKVRTLMKSDAQQEKQYALEKEVVDYVIEREKLLKQLSVLAQGDDQLAFNSFMASQQERQTSKNSKNPKESLNKLDWLEARIVSKLSEDHSVSTISPLIRSESNIVLKKLLYKVGGYIQKQWETNVLFELANTSGWERNRLVQGDKGLIWKFKESILLPFIQNVNGRKFVETSIRGMSVGLNSKLLSLINMGKIDDDMLESEISFRVMTLPTSVNSSATEIPVLTRLKLNCSSKSQEIRNENYPLEAVLKWMPNECSDVSIRIYFGNQYVEKRYEGYRGFLAFLRDYKGGKKTYKRSDFSTNGNLLVSLNIQHVKVRFRINSELSVDHLLRIASAEIPQRIVSQQVGDYYVAN